MNNTADGLITTGTQLIVLGLNIILIVFMLFIIFMIALIAMPSKKGSGTMYKTGKWKQKRSSILRRDGYECKHCKRHGKATLANTVHHIIPIEVDTTLAYTNQNLISLCNSCHESMHDRHNDTLSSTGTAYVNRYMKDYANEINNKLNNK